MTKVAVDADRCVGHGRCYTLAPEIFDADEVGHSILLVEDVSDKSEAVAADAARNCPEDAITVA